VGAGTVKIENGKKGMSKLATAAMTNLELSRELYTEDQRRQFYADYQAARYAAAASNDACIKHANLRGWKLWKGPTADWKEKNEQLLKSYRQAHITVKTMEQEHPLLVQVYMHKRNPILSA